MITLPTFIGATVRRTDRPRVQVQMVGTVVDYRLTGDTRVPCAVVRIPHLLTDAPEAAFNRWFHPTMLALVPSAVQS